MEKFVVSLPENTSERVDRYVSALFPDWSRARIQRRIERGEVLIDGMACRKSATVSDGSVVEIAGGGPSDSDLAAEDIPLDIVYENDDFAVIDKPARINVHPTPQEGGDRGTIVNALLGRYGVFATIYDERRPGIVHRLDRDTSGLLLVAKNELALRGLQDVIRSREVDKRYFALVRGSFEERSGTIESSIGRDRTDPTRMSVRDAINPKDAKTTFETVAPGPHGTTLVYVRIHTGRTHQIRVHLAAIGHPVVGDRVYGDLRVNALFERDFGLDRQWLHAASLRFAFGGVPYGFFREPPEELKRCIPSFRDYAVVSGTRSAL